MLRTAFAALLILAPVQAFAQYHGRDGSDRTTVFSRGYHECARRARSSDDCAKDEATYQDGKLNGAWKIVMARLSPARRADLRTDERNWIASRNDTCYSVDMDDHNDCMASETIKRIRYLERAR